MKPSLMSLRTFCPADRASAAAPTAVNDRPRKAGCQRHAEVMEFCSSPVHCSHRCLCGNSASASPAPTLRVHMPALPPPHRPGACFTRRPNSLELAMEMSLTSLGSSHTFLRPQPRTEEASLFCSFRETCTPHARTQFNHGVSMRAQAPRSRRAARCREAGLGRPLSPPPTVPKASEPLMDSWTSLRCPGQTPAGASRPLPPEHAARAAAHAPWCSPSTRPPNRRKRPVQAPGLPLGARFVPVPVDRNGISRNSQLCALQI